MTGKRWLMLGIVALALLVILAGRWLYRESADEVAAGAPEAESVLRPVADARLPELPPSGAVPAPPLANMDAPLPPQPESTVDAAVSMAAALKHGDPQAPKVVRDAPPEAPTAAELADPEAYQRYEARQQQRLYSQYVKAADSEIPRLQADIERARAAGLPTEQIAEGEEKLRRIQAMRDQLQADNPGMR